MIRSILAVLTGAALWPMLFLGANAGLVAAMPEAFREDGTTGVVFVLTMVLAYSVVFSVIAGFVTSLVARRRPVTHAFVLGLIQLAIGIGVQLSVWDRMPLWYHLCFLALLIPGNVLGGWVRAVRSPSFVHGA